MPVPKGNCIQLRNGRFAPETGQKDMEDLFVELGKSASRGRVVVHFHGGLVNTATGMRIAECLLPVYETAGAYPVFFVWGAGGWEVVESNIREIFKEPIFQQLLKRVTQFAIGKLAQTGGEKGVSIAEPDPFEVREELRRTESGEEPYATVDTHVLPESEELSPTEAAQFERALSLDPVVRSESQAIANEVVPEDETASERERSRGLRSTASRKTLMSPEVLDEVRAEGVEPGSRGLITTTRVIKGAVSVLAKVITRFSQKRDHGLYCTVVEELLREFYLANVGHGVWRLMKQDTQDAFGDSADCGGSAFVKGLRQSGAPGEERRITLIGHSTGAIYICHFLNCIDQSSLPPEVTFDVVLLAPACDFGLLARTLKDHGPRIRNLRLFGMKDELESRDQMVRFAYPRSLLYFVSAVCEDGNDVPLAGMQRFHSGEEPFDEHHFPDIASVAAFLSEKPERTVWSEEDSGPGRATRAHHHGDFDNEPTTLASLQRIIANGL